MRRAYSSLASVRRTMAEAAFGIAAISVVLAAGSPEPTPISGPVEGNSFAIGNVRVFDGARTTARATIVVRNGVIEAVGTRVSAPKELPFVDGAGRTLIPGLIDAHTHNARDETLFDAVRFGVTTELNMSSSVASAQSQRPRRDTVRRVMLADVWAAGTPATAPGGLGTAFGYPVPPISSPAEAGAFVRARISEGADFIKIIYEPGKDFPSISRDTLDAVVKAAHKRRKLAVVHVTSLQGARDAVAAGADGLMHVFYDAPIDEPLIQEMAKKDTFLVATLTIVLSNRTQERPWQELLQDPRIAPYLSEEQLQFLKRKQSPGVQQINPADPRSTVKRLQARGVDVLAGTDAGATGVLHGASLHGELALLVQAGLTPVQALAAATRLPAERFGLKDRGEIGPGRRADLVLVEGDPTANIKATRAIARVFKNGYEIDRAVPPASPGQGAARGARSGL
jgi:imidazolonepropionase-like amidohydrolase